MLSGLRVIISAPTLFLDEEHIRKQAANLETIQTETDVLDSEHIKCKCLPQMFLHYFILSNFGDAIFSFDC